ncbi:hypothetical protein HDU90_000352 [Geranomyces variabilis]|nr:hypothetical protein HDU90_000352 [Geranomyces variabilis]
MSSAAEQGTSNINQLASESGRVEKRSWVPVIPLTVLAPLLVAVALAGTLVPNTLIIDGASQRSASDISAKYLTTLMIDVKLRALAPLEKVTPVIQYLGTIPDVVSIFSAPPPLTGLVNHPVASDFINLKRQHQMDTVLYNSIPATHKVVQSLTNNPAADVDKTTSAYYKSTTTDYAYMAWMNGLSDPKNLSNNVFSVIDNGAPTVQSAYAVDPITLIPDTSSVLPYPFSQIIPGTGLMQLGLIQAAPAPFFTINKANNGLALGLVIQQFWEPGKSVYTGSLPKYACMGGIQITTTWINMLRDANPLNTSMVAMYDSKTLSVIGSSGMVVNNTASVSPAGVVSYGDPSPDPVAIAFQDVVRARYSTPFGTNPLKANLAAAYATVQAEPSYEIDFAGTRWIINVDIVGLGTYDYALLVLAIPRSEVYGEIDRARTRARGISIGVSVGMAVVIGGIFVLVVLPLSDLVREMAMLTKLDFGTLECSGALDNRSWVWEIRHVQVVFATMVKAFAGAIKKNRAMVNKQISSGPGVSSGSPQSVGAKSNNVKTAIILKKDEEV